MQHFCDFRAIMKLLPKDTCFLTEIVPVFVFILITAWTTSGKLNFLPECEHIIICSSFITHRIKNSSCSTSKNYLFKWLSLNSSYINAFPRITIFLKSDKKPFAFFPCMERWAKRPFSGFWKDGLLTELQAKTSRECRFMLF